MNIGIKRGKRVHLFYRSARHCTVGAEKCLMKNPSWVNQIEQNQEIDTLLSGQLVVLIFKQDIDECGGYIGYAVEILPLQAYFQISDSPVICRKMIFLWNRILNLGGDLPASEFPPSHPGPTGYIPLPPNCCYDIMLRRTNAHI